MTTVPGPLIWEIVKKNNAFLVKQFGNGTSSIRFSKEPNNLYNLNSYKHSGLANKKTVCIQGLVKDNAVVLATTSTKKQNKPKLLLNKSVMKKEFRRMAKAVTNQVGDNYYMPDLKNAARARLSVVHRSLRVAKSGPKKRNRQATKIPSFQPGNKLAKQRLLFSLSRISDDVLVCVDLRILVSLISYEFKQIHFEASILFFYTNSHELDLESD